MSNSSIVRGAERPREEAGWRAGRPVEDPTKTRRWGFVTVKPSEFLIHCRRGRVLDSSGQGATCFKWPWDSIAVVPTSFQRIQFVAEQVTRERVGVAITGLAVYRIAEPLLAFRVLNFSYPERAQQKLVETLTDMFVGATRRLVANLGVEECMQKRKRALAHELLREVAPVVGRRLDDWLPPVERAEIATWLAAVESAPLGEPVRRVVLQTPAGDTHLVELQGARMVGAKHLGVLVTLRQVEQQPSAALGH